VSAGRTPNHFEKGCSMTDAPRRRLRPARRGVVAALALALAAAVVLPACTSAKSSKDKIGFIFVSTKDDYGYNQAAYEGSQAVAKAFPNMPVLTAENVLENDDSVRVMEGMIRDGAKIIFATSYGHYKYALQVAKAHPEVTVIHQGGLIEGEAPPNFGTFFGTVYEPVYLAGVAAGKMTKTNKLGYVYAYAIPQTRNNINAFELGAKSVNPAAKTYAVATSNWCDVGAQQAAAKSLLSQGVDVMTQHQDCTATVIRAAESAGIYTVGYHADASALAPKGWITGSEWNWGPLYTKITQTIVDGKFKGSEFNKNYRVGYKTGDNPFVASKYGSAVPDDVKKLVDDAKKRISGKDGSPFVGPVTDQDGKMRIAAGTVPDYATIETQDYFVEGVIGKSS
jgi:basic membrane protein A and related proteins